jgi:hypothetical protein
MNKPTVYIDQNIIGLMLDGKINLTERPEFYWVYSTEHFAEIRRSSNAAKYLSALESIGAKLLKLDLDHNFKIIGTAQLIKHGTPSQHYKDYIEATGGVDISENLFDPFLAWINGGGHKGLLEKLPNNLAEQLLNITKDLPEAHSSLLANRLDVLTPEFNRVIEQLAEQGNDISESRKSMGGGKGAIGGIRGEKQIQQIWNIIGPTFAAVSCEQFFGFDPIEKQGYQKWPTYLGIVGCCAVMDIIGFQAEGKKSRKIEKLPNVRSDSVHIAMGAFCSAILSGDKRLIKRAKAIYEYKKIGNSPILIERKAKTIQSTTEATAD